MTTATAPATPVTLPLSIRTKFLQFRDDAQRGMVGRDTEIDACLIAMLSGANCFLIGPPGVGKSMLINAITDWIANR